ncbi:MAG TPA: hypothetical protein VMT38_07200 [Terracidiphilus sp.]|nr:hypothetical protein [Terracidiphilus sp.]
MTSLRQIEANRRNARLSTGPTTEKGKRRSRQNAIRHGLTAETVIDALEDADDYAAFELAIAADFDAQSAVERELVLRLASVLWRLRRASAIESGLFRIQARQLLQFRGARQVDGSRDGAIDTLCQTHIVPDCGPHLELNLDDNPASSAFVANQDDAPEDLTCSFLRLSSLPSHPLDRLSRYEAALWRQACQLLFALHFLDRRKPWERMRARIR